jgi:NAD(P)-dependent dehydrogenase (short-subunit alcohol dehydrogenase family)
MYNPYQLTGKTILITGASSGIGRATAIECSKMGAKLILTARNEERLKATLDSLEGSDHQMIVADLTLQSDVDSLVNLSPVLDGLVNDAGITITKPITFIRQEDLDKVLGINTFAPIMLTKTLLKKRKISNGASIVMVSSLASKTVAPGNAVYGISKSAIKTFAQYCALEVANKGIRVNSIHPGMVDSEMTRNLSFSQEELELDKKHYPIKRYGNPEEIAWSIIYLLSDATKWVTGTQLVIDGGAHLV